MSFDLDREELLRAIMDNEAEFLVSAYDDLRNQVKYWQERAEKSEAMRDALHEALAAARGTK